MGTRATPSRRQRRSRARLSPRELADAELARGTINARQHALRRQRIHLAECSGTWANDIWEGKDRDYAAERAAGVPGARAYTGSGPFKVRCDCCGRRMPPDLVHDFRGGKRCSECRMDDNSGFYEHVAGSAHRELIGEGR